MILIQISIIVQFSLDSTIQSYSHIKDLKFRNLLIILQSQLNILLKAFEVLEDRDLIHRYVYYVMKQMNLTNKSWKIEKNNIVDTSEIELGQRGVISENCGISVQI